MLSVRCLSCLFCLSVCSVGVLWPNGLTDQDETRHAVRPRSWPHCVRWGPSSPPLKGHSPPIFGPYLLRPNGCMDQDVTWYGGRPRLRRLCVRWEPRSSLTKRGQTPLNFRPMFIAAKRLEWMKLVLGTEVGFSPGDFVLDGDPVPFCQKGRIPLPNFSPFLLWPNGCMHQNAACQF